MAFTKATYDYLDAGGLINWQLIAKTSAFTAVSGEGYLVDTSSAAITVTLPDAPSAGDEIIIVDYASNAGTNNITLDPGTLNLRGATDDLVLSTNNQTARLLYSGATKGWLVTTESGGGAAASSSILPPVTSGMILNLQGSEYTSGSTWTDQSSQSNDFTLYNSPSFNSTTKAFTFDGVDDYARASSNIFGTTLTDLSVAVRFKTINPITTDSAFFLSQRESSGQGFLIWISSNTGELRCRYENSTRYEIDSVSSLSSNTDYTAVYTKSGNSHALYLNGSSTAIDSGSTSGSITLSSSNDTSIATDPYQLSYTAPIIYEIIVYNQGLSASESTSIHNYFVNKY
jgi:hypothetical protein